MSALIATSRLVTPPGEFSSGIAVSERWIETARRRPGINDEVPCVVDEFKPMLSPTPIGS